MPSRVKDSLYQESVSSARSLGGGARHSNFLPKNMGCSLCTSDAVQRCCVGWKGVCTMSVSHLKTRRQTRNISLPSFALMIILTRTVSEMCGEEEDNVLMEQLMCCQVVHLSWGGSYNCKLEIWKLLRKDGQMIEYMGCTVQTLWGRYRQSFGWSNAEVTPSFVWIHCSLLSFLPSRIWTVQSKHNSVYFTRNNSYYGNLISAGLKGVLHRISHKMRTSLVPRPRPALCHFQY